MKLLLDENLSFRVVAALADLFPGSVHVRDVGLQGAADDLIWTHAAENDYLLISKDTDFYERSLLYGAPPKVIWLRLGNSTVTETANLIRSQYIIVRRFAEDPTATFLPLSKAP